MKTINTILLTLSCLTTNAIGLDIYISGGINYMRPISGIQYRNYKANLTTPNWKVSISPVFKAGALLNIGPLALGGGCEVGTHQFKGTMQYFPGNEADATIIIGTPVIMPKVNLLYNITKTPNIYIGAGGGYSICKNTNRVIYSGYNVSIVAGIKYPIHKGLYIGTEINGQYNTVDPRYPLNAEPIKYINVPLFITLGYLIGRR